MEFHCIISVNRFINKKFSLTFLLFHLHRKKRKDDDKKLIHINIYIYINYQDYHPDIPEGYSWEVFNTD